MTKFLTEKEAAELLGLDEKMLRMLTKQRNGPPFFRPSRKIALYQAHELRDWQASWTRYNGSKAPATP